MINWITQETNPVYWAHTHCLTLEPRQLLSNLHIDSDIWVFSLPLYTAVHSSSLCSALSAATISCFFSAAVYYRPKNEAKDLVLVNKFESRNPCVMPLWKQQRWQFHQPLLRVTQLSITVKVYSSLYETHLGMKENNFLPGAFHLFFSKG